MTDTKAHGADASTGQMVAQLSEQVSHLVREELALAREEMVEKGKRAGLGAGLLGSAAVLGLYGVGTLFVTIAAALALAWPSWLAVLVVAVVIFVIVGVAALIGRRQVKEALPPTPTAAVAGTKADVETVKDAAHRS
jgi:uncharacterized membrane protein YqjE